MTDGVQDQAATDDRSRRGLCCQTGVTYIKRDFTPLTTTVVYIQQNVTVRMALYKGPPSNSRMKRIENPEGQIRQELRPNVNEGTNVIWEFQKRVGDCICD